jgi:hypothetical protein
MNMTNFKPAHFNWRADSGVAVITLRRACGHPVETLYREIRALWINEEASDGQMVVIARSVFAAGC